MAVEVWGGGGTGFGGGGAGGGAGGGPTPTGGSVTLLSEPLSHDTVDKIAATSTAPNAVDVNTFFQWVLRIAIVPFKFSAF